MERGQRTMKGRLKSLLRWLTEAAPAGDLAAKTVKSGVWMSAMQVSDRFLQIVLVVVLAALLGPAAFGIMGIALVTINALKRFSRLGFNEAMIHDADEDIDGYLNTAWTIQLLRGLALGTITFLAAPVIAGVFSEPAATDVLRVVAVSPVLVGLRNPAIIYFQKNLEFHKQFVYQMSGSLLNFIVALGIAFFVTRSVWALVVGYVLADATRSAISYLLHEYRPRPGLDREIARDLFNYGKWITGSGAILFLINEGDDAVVGILLSSTALGLYQVGYRLGKAPSREITQIVSGVLFPTYSKLQDDLDKLRSTFFMTVRVTTLFSFPVGVGIVVVAPTFIRGFMGAEWLSMVATVQIIAVYGLLVSFAATFGPVWKALGRPDYITKLGAVRLVLMAILVIPAVNAYGVTGMAAVVTGVYLFAIMPLDVHLASRAVETTNARLLSEVTYPLLASLSMGVVVYAVREALVLGPILEFGILVVVGVVSYILCVMILETQFDWGLQRDVEQVIDAVA
jgi:PST family polysaccharide transporter/lipopolysaccharide exporter